MTIATFKHIRDVGYSLAMENETLATHDKKVSYTEFSMSDKNYCVELKHSGYYWVFAFIPTGVMSDGTLIFSREYNAGLTFSLNAFVEDYFYQPKKTEQRVAYGSHC